MEQIAINTNAYATKKLRKESERGVRSRESYWRGNCVWLDIIAYMGVHCPPAVKDYWKYDSLNPTHPIRDYRGLTRFEEIGG